MDKQKIKSFSFEMLLLTVGAVLVGVGVYFFKIPNNFSTGGVSGISIILSYLINLSWLPAGALLTIINVLLVVVGRLVVGKEFTYKTIYCSILMSALTWVLEFIVPLDKPLTDQPVLELLFAIALPSLGSAILFYENASTGGTDIIAMMIKKHSSLNISNALLVADALIVLATCFVFDIQTFLFCVLGLIAKVLVVNLLLQKINLSKHCVIITSKEYEEPICKYVTEVLGKSATISEGFSSAYLHEDKTVIITVVKAKQALKLKKFVKETDNHSFMIVTETSTIYGKGFRETM